MMLFRFFRKLSGVVTLSQGRVWGDGGYRAVTGYCVAAAVCWVLSSASIVPSCNTWDKIPGSASVCLPVCRYSSSRCPYHPFVQRLAQLAAAISYTLQALLCDNN